MRLLVQAFSSQGGSRGRRSDVDLGRQRFRRRILMPKGASPPGTRRRKRATCAEAGSQVTPTLAPFRESRQPSPKWVQTIDFDCCGAIFRRWLRSSCAGGRVDAGPAAGEGTRNAPEERWRRFRRAAERVQKAMPKPWRSEFRSNCANDSEAIPRPRGIRPPNARSRVATTLGTFLEATATHAEAGRKGRARALRTGRRTKSPPWMRRL